jgi:hypothetical protein
LDVPAGKRYHYGRRDYSPGLSGFAGSLEGKVILFRDITSN